MRKLTIKHKMIGCWMLLFFTTTPFFSCKDSNADTTTKTEPATQPVQENQGESEENNMKSENDLNQTGTAKQDYVKMIGLKVMLVKGGQSSTLTSNMEMGNGSIVMIDGNIKMKDGTIKLLSEGEIVYMDGSMGQVNKNKNRRN